MFLLKNVRYKKILDIADLLIEDQKITCITGESGSGKSTLLRLVNKLISSDSGVIYLNGEQLSSIPSVSLRRKVLMLPQTPVIFPGSVRDNLLIGLLFTGQKPVDDPLMVSIMDWLHLHVDLDSDCEPLSGGEKQRLSIARMILIDPDVFLLDEPTSALDENTEQNVIDQVAQYAKEKGKTLIIVTHSKQLTQRIADIVVEIKSGKIISREVLRP